MQNLTGKICLVTGGTAGLGRAIATSLARQGATVIITARSKSAGELVATEIKKISGNSNVSVLEVDFAKQPSIKQAAQEFKSQHPALNILVNCAAVYKQKLELTDDGLEMMFAVNHLGYFILTNLLLDTLKAGAPARIINITAPSTSQLNFDDLQGQKKFSPLNRFGVSKMANLLFTFALAQKLEGTGVTANAIHPGLTKSALMHEAPAPIRWFLNLVSKTPEKAAESIVDVAILPQYSGKNGLFFSKGKEIKAAPYANDKQVQGQLWDVSVKLSGL